MASIINATDVVVKFEGKIVGCAQSADFTISREMDEATCAASGGWKQSSPGQKSWNGSFSAVFRSFTEAEAATEVTFEDLYDALDEGTEVDIEYSRVGVVGRRYTDKAFISELGYSQPDKGTVTWTASYEGNGAFSSVAAA